MIYLIAGNQYCEDFFNGYATNEQELKEMIVKYGKERSYIIPIESIKLNMKKGEANFIEIEDYMGGEEGETWQGMVHIFPIPHEKDVVIKDFFEE